LAVSDEVITVSDFGGRAWATDEDIAAGRYRNFPTPRQAADYIVQTAMKDEVILLKGSSNLHLERILLQFRSPVRCWVSDCGRTDSCLSCGLFEHDHPAHRALRRAARRRTFLRRLFGRPKDPSAVAPPR
jgi:UDP-N-acetylmuramoyl-tripeptide--D-alanyl-D-alanine ligase